MAKGLSASQVFGRWKTTANWRQKGKLLREKGQA